MALSTAPRSVLIIRLSSIGDILLATPLLRIFKKKFPEAQIDFVIKKEFVDLIYYHPSINRIYVFDKARGFSELRKIKSEIKKQRYDLIVDIHKNIRSYYLRTRVGAARLVKFEKKAWQRFLLVNFKLNFYREIIPVYLRYLNSVKDYGLEDDGLGLDFYFNPRVKTEVKARLNAFYGNHFDLIVGMAPGAGFATKRWTLEGFTQTAERLSKEFNAGILLFGNQQDYSLASRIAERLPKAALNLAGRFSLMETAAAIDVCHLVICNDTGLMHLASALKKKVVAIFGPTTEELGFFPYTTEYIVVQKNLSCRPCSHIGSHRCPRGHFRCMREITPEEVVMAARFLYDSTF